jgi:hypothetical protein
LLRNEKQERQSTKQQVTVFLASIDYVSPTSAALDCPNQLHEFSIKKVARLCIHGHGCLTSEIRTSGLPPSNAPFSFSHSQNFSTLLAVVAPPPACASLNVESAAIALLHLLAPAWVCLFQRIWLFQRPNVLPKNWRTGTELSAILFRGTLLLFARAGRVLLLRAPQCPTEWCFRAFEAAEFVSAWEVRVPTPQSWLHEQEIAQSAPVILLRCTCKHAERPRRLAFVSSTWIHKKEGVPFTLNPKNVLSVPILLSPIKKVGPHLYICWWLLLDSAQSLRLRARLGRFKIAESETVWSSSKWVSKVITPN